MDSNFPYIRNGLLYRAAAFLLNYVVALPLVSVYIFLVNGTKIVNRGAINRIQGACFLYGNHTHWSDSFLVHVIAAPKRTYILANPDAVSIKGLKNIVLMLGTIPVPTNLGCFRAFMDALETRSKQNACITVYPEAHIWPYYTGIRQFPDTSFKYPAKFGVPVVAMVTTFRKRTGLLRWIKTPARTIVLSDPIYAKEGMSVREAQQYYHEQVYEFMKSHVEQPENYAYIQYIQK